MLAGLEVAAEPAPASGSLSETTVFDVAIAADGMPNGGFEASGETVFVTGWS